MSGGAGILQAQTFLSEIPKNPEAIAARTFQKNPRAFKRKTPEHLDGRRVRQRFHSRGSQREEPAKPIQHNIQKKGTGATRPCRPLCKRRDAVKYLYPALVGDSHPFRGAELEHSEDMTKLPTAPRLVRSIAHNSRRQSASPSRCSSDASDQCGRMQPHDRATLSGLAQDCQVGWQVSLASFSGVSLARLCCRSLLAQGRLTSTSSLPRRGRSLDAT